MKIYLGADHRGFKLKEQLQTWLGNQGFEVIDCGNTQYDPADDFSDFALKVAQRVQQDLSSRGVVICGSGVGVNIMANKVKGIRASIAMSEDQVHHARQREDLNVLVISADYTSLVEAKTITTVFLATSFEPEERFVRRLKKITDYEALS
ncbi:RpiB/LacA/LacB family sugar-phosphate isomerase [Patescibacteria group bacterium]|nr:RpiB/LacA/LacB family sugar-phosphate isomerase [Patescibacteria group bacterium]MBU1967217.1 RpiB/LacA/LacB family sugar-phosphate isomerase [Patescibacteria group bacterium]MBU2543163.1 RpiB/LacA/LacB family sugar-phosphate isomerase [Patescibacteria group bacterium]